MSGNTNKTDDFLDSVCEKVKCKAMHGDIRAELMSHILGIKERLTGEGKPEQEAEDIALQEMGDPQEIGLRLDKIHRPKPEWSVIFLAAAIFLIGMLSFSNQYYQFLLQYSPSDAVEHILVTICGLIIFLSVYFFDIRKIQRYSLLIFLISAAALVMLPLFVGRGVDGLTIRARAITPFVAVAVLSLSASIYQYRNNIKILAFISACAVAASISLHFSSNFLWALTLLLIFSLLMLLTLRPIRKRRIAEKILFGFSAVVLLVVAAFVVWLLIHCVQLIVFHAVYSNYLQGFSHIRFIGKSDVNLDLYGSGYSLSNMLTNFGYLFSFLVLFALVAFAIRVVKSSVGIKDNFYRNTSIIIGAVFVLEDVAGLLNEAGMRLAGQDFGFSLFPFLWQDAADYIFNAILLAVFLSCYRRKNITPSAQLAK